jgi:hypothetical protein
MRRSFGQPAILVCTLCASLSGAQVAVVTYHNDNARTGQNLKETILTPAKVGGGSFGMRFAYTVDGNVYAQPLYKPGVEISGLGKHNVVFVATENDSVYAFDADSNTGTNALPLWQAAFANPANGVTAVPAKDVACISPAPSVGITGTPVIDQATGTLYVVAKTKEVSGSVTKYYQRLHALDLTSGAEKFGGPFVIAASVPGSCSLSVKGRVTFDPLRHNQRAGLALSSQGILYITWGSHCDQDPYTGWVMAFNPKNGKLLHAFNDVPDTVSGSTVCRGGIWQGGAAPAADTSGNLFLATGNGNFTADAGGPDFGDSILKLTDSAKGLAVADSFTPYNQASLDLVDGDVGSGGVLILPDQPGAYPHLLVQSGKEGSIYLVNRDSMGQYNSAGDTQIVQELPNAIGGIWGMPAYFNGTIYFGGEYDSMKAFSLTNGLLGATPASQSATVYGYPGPTVSISANGTSNGVVWAVDNSGAYQGGLPAVLHAYDAANLVSELYNSNLNPARDRLGPAVAFTVPTIADGKVFVGTGNSLAVFGLLPNGPDFGLAAQPASLSLAPGTSNNFEVIVQAAPGFGFKGIVKLSTGSLPQGVTAVFSPTSLHGATSGNLQISVSSSVSPGSYAITINGTSGGVTASATVTLVVQEPSPILFPGGSLTVPNASGGVSFTYNGTLSQIDTVAFNQSGDPCDASGDTYCTNGAGVLTVAGILPVGGTETFEAGKWNYGALLMSISGIGPGGTVQIFPADVQNGLGSSTPPLSLTLPSVSLSALGFGNFMVTNPTITFYIAATDYTNHSGQFVLTQSPDDSSSGKHSKDKPPAR